MFTGLVEDVGTITGVESNEAGREFRIACRYDDLALGESIACAGACLTVRDHGAGWFTVAAVTTTLGRTTIGDWREGRRINLERSLRAGDRLGGHIVQGHVDGVGNVLATARSGDAWLIDIAVPADVAELLVPHGSVCVDGVSLTVNRVDGDSFEVNLIPHTVQVTTLSRLKPGERVNLEIDLIARYVERMPAGDR